MPGQYATAYLSSIVLESIYLFLQSLWRHTVIYVWPIHTIYKLNIQLVHTPNMMCEEPCCGWVHNQNPTNLQNELSVE